MKKLELTKETIVPLVDAQASSVHGGTTSAICATARTTTHVITLTTSRNTCGSLHTCRWSGITTQKCD